MEEKIKKLLFSCNPINIELAFTISKDTEKIAMKEFKELIDFIEERTLRPNYSFRDGSCRQYGMKHFIKEAIKHWTSKKHFSLGCVEIKKLPDNIGILKNLENLSIPYNELTELPNSFENLESLRKLNLCSNNFTKFPKVLFKLKKLDYLHIDGNNISEEEILKFSNELPECFVTYDPNQGSKKKRIILNNKKIV
jgi:Leucine-rich repeat (LRR) protein